MANAVFKIRYIRYSRYVRFFHSSYNFRHVHSTYPFVIFIRYTKKGKEKEEAGEKIDAVLTTDKKGKLVSKQAWHV